MKKTITLLMIFVLLLAACSNNEEASETTENFEFGDDSAEEEEDTTADLYEEAEKNFKSMLTGYEESFSYTSSTDGAEGKMSIEGDYDASSGELTVKIADEELNTKFTINRDDKITYSQDIDVDTLSSLGFTFEDMLSPVTNSSMIFTMIDANYFEEDGNFLVSEQESSYLDASYSIKISKDGKNLNYSVADEEETAETSISFK